MTPSPYWHGAPPGAPGPAPYRDMPPHSGTRPAASFGRRLSARVIDYTVIGMAVVLFFILVSFLAEASLRGGELADRYFDAWAMLFFFGTGPVMFLHDWLCNAAHGRTLGKAALGIRVVRRDGGPLRQGQSAGRAAIFGLPQAVPCLGGLFTLIDCLSALADSESARTLHDRAAGTVVVRG
ncbi:RDD family protein [Streptomonospora wellingtoniae]|uniref:RDD family protein n=1 Tax=Streptomonospora wellingtoniae TaxID=3075544 RepID=A0ABU2KZ01_9ACTN|nr:RDD family protein [Streptomonospora sp. DSM 45055]MDT0304540.1 RDD family protein [Streptomonospora sp. DSM 45055]